MLNYKSKSAYKEQAKEQIIDYRSKEKKKVQLRAGEQRQFLTAGCILCAIYKRLSADGNVIEIFLLLLSL